MQSREMPSKTSQPHDKVGSPTRGQVGMAAPDKRDGAVIPFARPRAISSLGPTTFGIPSIAKPAATAIKEEAPPRRRSRRSTPPNEMKVTPLFGYQAQGAPAAP